MDCVTCMLMGMCMLCTSDMSASEPGRPMTRAEVDQAVVRVVHRFRQAAEKEELDRMQRKLQERRRDGYERRQNFYDDPRYSYAGIGKRSSVDVLAPVAFPSGAGVRSKMVSHTKDVKPQRNTVDEMTPIAYPSGMRSKMVSHTKDVKPQRNTVDVMTPIAYPSGMRSKMVSHTKDENPREVLSGKVLVLYPAHNNRKLMLRRLILPFGARRDGHLKMLQSPGKSSSAKGSKRETTLKRSTDLTGESVKRMRLGTYIFKVKPGFKSNSNAPGSLLTKLFNRNRFSKKGNLFKASFQRSEIEKDNNEKLIGILLRKRSRH